jgi:predicted CXXCH cytochrome family protein
MKTIATAVLLVGIWLGGAADQRSTPTSLPADAAYPLTEYRRGLIGSKHDFSKILGGAANACSACHVPHMMALRPATEPMGRPTTLPSPVEIFRIADQRHIFAPDRFTPGPTSLLCMGCHDGTVAPSTVGSGHALLAGIRPGFTLPPEFVWRDHPIGVPYPRNNREYHPEMTVTAGGRILLPDGCVECISCHDPHNRWGQDHMLVKSNRRSALCLSCHIK